MIIQHQKHTPTRRQSIKNVAQGKAIASCAMVNGQPRVSVSVVNSLTELAPYVLRMSLEEARDLVEKINAQIHKLDYFAQYGTWRGTWDDDRRIEKERRAKQDRLNSAP